MKLTVERLHEFLRYDPGTGTFTMLVRAYGKRPGDPAGARKPEGYLRIRIDGQEYYAAPLAWLYMTGSFLPKGIEVDHRDKDPSNDRWANLRLATQGQNRANRRTWRSGLKGAYPVTRGFTSFIQKNGVRRYLGFFPTEQAAHDAYCAAARQTHGHFASLT